MNDFRRILMASTLVLNLTLSAGGTTMLIPTRQHSWRLQSILAILTALAAIPIAAAPLPSQGADAATLTDCAGQPDGTSCDDGVACDLGETCRSGLCLAPASFAAAAGSPITVGDGPHAVVARDLNNDGKLDLAVANTANSNSISILLGNGSGGFTPAAGSPVAVGPNPYAIAVGDFNGDTQLDLAVANFGSDNVTILLGNGSGGFAQAAGSPLAVGNDPFSIATADLSGDGKLDLAVTNFHSNDVTIFLGNGLGGFSQAAGSPVAVGTSPGSVAIGDLNGDAKADVAVANSASNNVTILLGNGAGGFSPAGGSPVAVGNIPFSVVAADLNRDGSLDLAVANDAANAHSVTILLGNGTGAFTQAVGSPVGAGTNPESLAVGDLNGDGAPDLAVANAGSGNVTVLLGNGAGRFAQPAGSPFSSGSVSRSVAIGDLSGDGRLDLAVANNGSNNVTVLLNTTTSAPDGTACEDGNGCTVGETCRSFVCEAPVSLAPAGVATTRSHPYSIAIGDVNGDTFVDFAVPNDGSNNVTILLGNGSGGFSSTGVPDVTAGNRPQSVVLGHMNGDGRLDLAVANRSSGNVMIFLGNGLGGFSQAPGSPFPSGPNPSALAAGDVNGDGKLDLAVADFGSNTVLIFLGNGSAGFSQSAGSPVPVGGGQSAIALGDLNGDGKLDFAAAKSGSNDVAVRFGDGSGGFSQPPGSNYLVGVSPSSIAIGDVNTDGKPDLAVANNGSSNVTILLGNGSLGFSQLGSPLSVGGLPDSLVLRDLNGDGKLDLAVANNGSNNVTILRGNGAGAFSEIAGSPMAADFGPIAIAAADFNGDAKLDVAVVNHNANDVSILLNTAASAQNGTACNDGNACTVGESCTGWSCAGGSAPSCDDGNVCTDDSCNTVTGCAHTNNTASCDDANACTVGDTCQSGGCLGTGLRDADGDGHPDVSCGGDDCDDLHGTTYPNAPEVNDGRDNQCPGNPGFGVIDEVSGAAGFTDPANENRFCWAAQTGATSYQVARSTRADFTTDCVTATVTDTCLVDPFVPPLGQGYFYLVRALTPAVGSWGQRSSGSEITVPCAP
jgi:hypothetical protein